jgi:hypothetical protein
VIEVELGAGAFWLLIVVGALSGAVSIWAFRKWSNAAKLRVAINRIVAHLMEFRLFADEPALIVRAQYNLLAANARFLKLLLLPSLLLLPFFVILLVGLDAVFDKAPLPVNRPAVVTVQFSEASSSPLPDVRLEVPAGMSVETEPVRIPVDSQISWRVRPKSRLAGELRVLYNGQAIAKNFSSGTGLQWLSERRSGSLTGFLRQPFEAPFAASTVKSISLRYPPATVFATNWLVWFSAGSILGAMAAGLFLQRRQAYLPY